MSGRLERHARVGSKAPGRAAAGIGGMKRALAACQNVVSGSRFLTPLPPALQGAHRNFEHGRGARGGRCWPRPHGGNQHDDQRQIDVADQKPDRGRRRARATTVAAEAEPRAEIGAQFERTAARFARIVVDMKDTTTGAPDAAPLQGEFLIHTQQQPKKVEVLQ